MFFLEPIEAFIWTKNQPIQAFNIIGGTAAANKGLTCVTLLGHLFYSVQLWLKLGNGTQMLKAYGRPGNSFREKNNFFLVSARLEAALQLLWLEHNPVSRQGSCQSTSKHLGLTVSR